MTPTPIDAVHALLEPFVSAHSRTYWPALLASVVVASAFARRGFLPALRREWKRWIHVSSRLDAQLLVARQMLRVLGWIPQLGGAWWLATQLVGRLDALLGAPDWPAPTWAVSIAYTLTLFVAWDASRFLVHRLFHAVPGLWAFHQVHHSAEVLTPLTFHRVHPVESLAYQLRGVVVTAGVAGLFFWAFRDAASPVLWMGVHALGLAFNVVSGNLRHSHCWWSFGPAIERWFISPAQHQMHHGRTDALQRCNYGTWLAMWDRLAGSWRAADERPEAFGIEAPNHEHHLLSAWFGPIRALLAPSLVVAMGLAATQEAAAEESAEDQPSESIVVVGDRGKPRVAGSAHVVGEEKLETHEYNDIHQVLAEVPGLYVRGEDGFGLRPNIGIRGANSDRSAKLTLLEDGVLFAPAPYAAPAAYYFPMSTRLVGVEVFKGPAATQHGPHTVGGAINLRTREVPTSTSSAFDLSFGEHLTRKAHLWAGTGDERRGLLAEAAHIGTDGFKELDGGGPTGFLRQDFMLKGRLGSDPDLSHKRAVELKLGYGSERSHETYLGLSPADAAATPLRRYAASSQGLMRWHRTQAEVAVPVRLGSSLTVRTVAYHHFLTRQWTKFNALASGIDTHALLSSPDTGGQAAAALALLRGEEDSVSPDQNLLIGTNDRRFHAFGLQSHATLRGGSGNLRSRTEFGLRFHGDVVDRLHTEEPFAMLNGSLVASGAATDTTLDTKDTAFAVAAHVHETLEVYNRVQVLPGIRAEFIRTRHANEPSDLTVVVLPGMAALVELRPALDVFAGAHRGFSPVSPRSAGQADPETTWAYEAGIRAGHLDAGPSLELVGFINDYANLTGQCTLSGGCDDTRVDESFDAGEVFVAGLEAAGAARIALPGRLSLPIEATYTLTHARFSTSFSSGFPQFGDVEQGDHLPYLPAHQGSLHAGLHHSHFRLSSTLTGRTSLLDEAGQPGEAQVAGIPGRVLVDVALHVPLGDRLTAYATASNIGNTQTIESWRPFGARPNAPRQVNVGLKGRFGASN